MHEKTELLKKWKRTQNNFFFQLRGYLKRKGLHIDDDKELCDMLRKCIRADKSHQD